MTLLYARCPSTIAKKNKSACFWNRLPLRLQVMLQGRRFLTQHSITALLHHCFEWLQHCSKQQRCVAMTRKSSLQIVLCLTSP